MGGGGSNKTRAGRERGVEGFVATLSGMREQIEDWELQDWM